MHITKELWERYEASNSKKRRKSKTLSAVHAYVCEIRAERTESRRIENPLAGRAYRKKMELVRQRNLAEVRAVMSEIHGGGSPFAGEIILGFENTPEGDRTICPL